MFELNTKHGQVVVYAETVEQEAISQIYDMANSPLGQDAHIRIMPDCHAGAGCTIGTTMKITDKVCPNLIGVDIGCGVTLIKTNINFEDRLVELDSAIRKRVPFGLDIHLDDKLWPFEDLISWTSLDDDTRMRAMKSLGTLGGGNHFIEAYTDGWLAVHSGSRNIGYKVAKYYQKLAETWVKDHNRIVVFEQMKQIEPALRQQWYAANKIKTSRDLSYLMGSDMEDYLHDMVIMQKFAANNREAILLSILSEMNGACLDMIESVHNYIDFNDMHLRKGAISAKNGEQLVIPLNMRDGILICCGKGNPEWNYSAPHGAGRLYSRSETKKQFTVGQYVEQMQGIFSTCINSSTLDEAPFAYKDYKEIMRCIEPTVDIIDRLVPIFNFKASE